MTPWAAALLAALPFSPPGAPLRVHAGFGTGQLARDADSEDHVRTGQVVFEWLGESARAGVAYASISRDVERRCTPAADDPQPGRCPQGGASGRDATHALGLTAGWSGSWFGLTGGWQMAWRHRIDPQGTARDTHALTPAVSARLGPADALALRGAWHDPGPETPGVGDLRGGVEFVPGRARVLVGATATSPAWGLLLAGQVPLGDRVGLAVHGAAHPTAPSRLVLVGVALTLAFDPTAADFP